MRRSTTLACGAFPLLVAACSSASSGGGVASGDAGADVSAHDAGGHDSPFESSPGDASSGPDAGSDAGDGSTLACALPVVLSTAPACNACVAQYCDPVWCTCAADTANADDAGDAGANGCERYVACVAECVLTDAGLPTTCAQTVCATAPYSTQEQQDGRQLLDCVVLHCSNECPQE